jgi:hypothetical protein
LAEDIEIMFWRDKTFDICVVVTSKTSEISPAAIGLRHGDSRQRIKARAKAMDNDQSGTLDNLQGSNFNNGFL